MKDPSCVLAANGSVSIRVGEAGATPILKAAAVVAGKDLKGKEKPWMAFV